MSNVVIFYSYFARETPAFRPGRDSAACVASHTPALLSVLLPLHNRAIICKSIIKGSDYASVYKMWY